MLRALVTRIFYSGKIQAAVIVASVLLFVWWRVWAVTPSWAAGD